MKKFAVILMGIIILSLTLTACPAEPDAPKDVSTVKITNIPSGYYKAYVKLSNSMSAADNHIAAGRFAAGSDPSSNTLPAEVTISELYVGVRPQEQYATRWSGRSNYITVVFSPATATSFDSLRMYGFMSLPSGPEAVLDINDAILIQKGGAFVADGDLDILYNDAIRGDPDTNRPITP